MPRPRARRVELIEAKDPAADYIERLLVHLDNNVARVEELLIEMLRRRDHWLRHVMDNERAALEGALAAERRAVLDRVQLLLPAAVRGELLAVANIACANLGQPPLASLPGSDDAAGWAALAHLLLTKKDEWRKSLTKNDGFPAGAAHAAAKQRALALIDGLRANDALRAALADTRRLPPPAYTEAQWRVLEAISELLKRAVGQLKLVFQSRGQVDFTEVSQRALLALEDTEGPTDLALRLDYQIRHLLIDEFQDTSISQFELLARLTAGWTPDDGRTLFAVGDPMQSIYRFREAEVGLFLRARAEGIGTVVLEPLELSANFRSQEGIVAWVNAGVRTGDARARGHRLGRGRIYRIEGGTSAFGGRGGGNPSAVRRRCRERSRGGGESRGRHRSQAQADWRERSGRASPSSCAGATTCAKSCRS